MTENYEICLGGYFFVADVTTAHSKASDIKLIFWPSLFLADQKHLGLQMKHESLDYWTEVVNSAILNFFLRKALLKGFKQLLCDLL